MRRAYDPLETGVAGRRGGALSGQGLLARRDLFAGAAEPRRGAAWRRRRGRHGSTLWTYGDLLQKAETAAAGFLAIGLKPGDRVVVQLPNRPEFLSVVFGLFRAQLIPVYALPAHRTTEIVHFVMRAEATAYVVADRHEGFDYRALARAVQAEVPELRHVVVVGEAEEFTAFDGFRADPAALPSTDADPSDVAFLQISGGSTGLSKLIPRTHDDYLYSVRESADISGLEPESVYLTALPGRA